MLEDALVNRLKLRFPDGGIRSLRVKVGPLPPRPEVPKKRTLERGARITSLPEEIARELATVRDDELRSALSSTVEATLRRPKSGPE